MREWSGARGSDVAARQAGNAFVDRQGVVDFDIAPDGKRSLAVVKDTRPPTAAHGEITRRDGVGDEEIVEPKGVSPSQRGVTNAQLGFVAMVWCPGDRPL
jgi:hypothetical protein